MKKLAFFEFDHNLISGVVLSWLPSFENGYYWRSYNLGEEEHLG